MVLFWNVTKENTDLKIECEATKALAEGASLNLNSVAKMGRQFSRPPQLDSGWLCSFAEASVTFGNPSQRFLRVLGISPKSSESSSRKSEHSLGFLERVQVSLTLLNSDQLRGFAEASVAFVDPSQRFLWVLGVSPKASESSSKQSESSLGFPCDPQIVITVLYKYEALPLQNIITFTSLNSLNPRSDLRLSA